MTVHKGTAHYQSTVVFIHVEVKTVSDVNDVILQAVAFVNAKVTSCADNRTTTLKKLPTVRATIFVISKIFQNYF